MALPTETTSLRSSTGITDSEFKQLRDFIHQKSGIFIADNRKYLIENRLAGRIRALNLKSYGEYYSYLKFDPNRQAELTYLFNAVTTNETSFFRNPPQLEVFQKVDTALNIDISIINIYNHNNIAAEYISHLLACGKYRLNSTYTYVNISGTISDIQDDQRSLKYYHVGHALCPT